MQFRTQAVHHGVDKDLSYNSVTTPIYPTSTFYYDRLGVNKGYDYTRSGNPTRSALEENLAALEGAAACWCTSSGMSATATVLHLLKPGEEVIAGMDVYGGTFRAMTRVFSKYGIRFSFVDLTDAENLRRAWTPQTRMVWIETPSNPLLRLLDIAALSAIARERGGLSVVDNTFMSPYFQRPLALGADIVYHSTTKYLNGHSDVIGGAILTATRELGDEVYFLVNALGQGQAPMDSWLVLRGVKTLPLRMVAHDANGMALAKFLASHPRVKQVFYPGLPSHPGHALAKQQMTGFGGMLSFELDVDKVSLDDFFARLKLYYLCVSLGGVESLISAPWYMSHASMPPEAKRAAGIGEGLVRISAGIEAPEDLIADLQHGLEGC
jgi:cystathionine beta-lyase/cystathionine gamma-synthase